MPELTIIMPTYNTISRNGDGHLQQAIESLLNQTYNDFELHILDNLSTDTTFNICKQYATKDNRINLFIDTKKRSYENSINKLVGNVSTKYIMLANCNCLWNHYYIASLLPHLKKEKIECVYSNGNFIDTKNHLGTSLIQDSKINCYAKKIVENFRVAIEYKNMISIIHGIFKTDAYQKTLSFKAFNNLKANIDNLFLLKFVLNGYKAKLVNKDLFYYRNGSREFCRNSTKDMPNSPIYMLVYYINHYLKFYNEVIKYTDDILLRIILFDSIIKTIPTTIQYIIRDMVLDKVEFQIMATIYKRYSYINDLLLKDIHKELTKGLITDTYKKGRILKNYIMKYIEDVMMPYKLIEEVTASLENINEEFEKQSKQQEK